jgi:outer membrane protein assembly factor BamA
LPEGEKLYTGAKLKPESIERVDKGLIKSVVKEALRPEPNKSYFGMRPQLMLYTMPGEKPTTKLGRWIKKRGDAPVLMSQVRPQATAAIIDAMLFNNGIFNGITSYKIIEKEKTASVEYTSFVHKPYLIQAYQYAISDDSMAAIILSGNDKSFIRTGDVYNLDVFKNERFRIDNLLKNKGYFYFNPDYLLFKADTSVVSHTISLQLTLKNDIPANALISYRINKVIINQNYSLQENTDSLPNSFDYENYLFIGKQAEMNIDPKVVLRSVYIKKNEIYSRENHTSTLNRLMSMGSFKFIQLRFSDSDTTSTGFLDATVLMTPVPTYTFKAGLDIVTKSNDYSGPRINVSLTDRNAFKGAEMLNVSMAGSFEAQLSNSKLYSYSWNPQAELVFPRIIAPFRVKTAGFYIPRTRFLLSYNYLKRVNYFDMNTFQFIYGYKWKDDIRQEQEFNPVNISYTTIRNQSEPFTELLNSNPFLKKSYEEQFIAGASYLYTYNEQMISGKKIQTYAQVRAETGGNLFSLAKSIGGEIVSADNPSKIFGSVYSQYAKISVEGRAYYNFISQNKIALRLFAGMAHSYGNSSTLPYSKQFFSGGPNSIRAFLINSLGPGTYLQNTNLNSFLQLGGDVKVEMNAEYRFNIYKFFKGALFVDAGNVWLQRANSAGIGTPFMFSSFMNELAIGAGLGLRVDMSFFVLRFDMAIPLRKPWFPENERWVLNQINFNDPTWMTQNLVLNIAIGYPF